MPWHVSQVLVLLLYLACAVAATAKTTLIELQIGDKVALGDLVVPDGGSLADGVLLLTHGTLAHKDMEMIGSLQSALSERGVATIAHTLTLGQDRRRGMYRCGHPHTHRHHDAVEEIATWVGWLKTNGAAKVSVLGHSRGGSQVAWFAAERGVIDKLVLMAPATGRSHRQVEEAYRNRFKAELAPHLKTAEELVSKQKGEVLLDLPGFIYCPKAKATANSVVSYYGAEPKRATTFHLGKIKVPVLVIAGSKDIVVPDVPDRFRTIADGKRLRLEVIEDADHMFLDFYAEDAADLIAAFLRE